jgi:hypothetical protein
MKRKIDFDDKQNYQKGNLFGKGSSKKVYLVPNHPDKVMKFGYNVINESHIFYDNPKFTPKIFFINYKREYSVVEKLDVEKAITDFKKYIIGTTNKDLYRYRHFIKNDIFETLKENFKTEESLNFLLRIRDIVIATKMDDIRAENFGYDSNGILKCLDL